MTRIASILCPIDFSDQSRVALDQAEDLARTLGAELIVAHVVEPAVYPMAFGAVPMSTDNIEERAKSAAEDSLQVVVAEIAERGVNASSLVGAGTAALRIVEMVKQNGFDLVVLGTHGLTGLSHALLGSVAERVVRNCPCPVLSVKANGATD